MSIGILGKKVSMSQFFRDDGTVVPVSIIQAGPCPVIQIKEPQPDGYKAIQIGFIDKKASMANKAQLGHLKKSNTSPKKYIREIRLSELDPKFELGQLINVDIFSAGDYVDITGKSIGKGFQGGVKRWGWHGGSMTHGSTTHRRAGSIGSSTTPGRVIKGHHMPGHMGFRKVTVQNLEVIQVDKDKNLLTVKGPVPGAQNGLLIIQKAKKKLHVKSKVALEKSEKKEKTSASAKSSKKK